MRRYLMDIIYIYHIFLQRITLRKLQILASLIKLWKSRLSFSPFSYCQTHAEEGPVPVCSDGWRIFQQGHKGLHLQPYGCRPCDRLQGRQERSQGGDGPRREGEVQGQDHCIEDKQRTQGQLPGTETVLEGQELHNGPKACSPDADNEEDKEGGEDDPGKKGRLKRKRNVTLIPV